LDFLHTKIHAHNMHLFFSLLFSTTYFPTHRVSGAPFSSNIMKNILITRTQIRTTYKHEQLQFKMYLATAQVFTRANNNIVHILQIKAKRRINRGHSCMH
jgi:hypothetical protein